MTTKTATSANGAGGDAAPAKPEITYYATRNFRDAGTEDSFTKGEEVKAGKGRLANYAAAGLVTTEKPAAVGE
jgi:hypothetical protein